MKTSCYHLCGNGSFTDEAVQYIVFTVRSLVGGASSFEVLNIDNLLLAFALTLVWECRCSFVQLSYFFWILFLWPVGCQTLFLCPLATVLLPFNIYFKFTLYMYVSVWVCAHVYVWVSKRLEVLKLIIVSLRTQDRIWTLVLRLEQQVLLTSNWLPLLCFYT